MYYSENDDTKVMGVAWYSRDQWKHLCDIAEDRDQLEEAYKEWEDKAEKSVRVFKEKGIHAEKVYVDINELVDWCVENKYPVNSESRSTFVAYKIRDKYTKGQKNNKSGKEIHGFFDDAGNPVNDDLISKPSLCVTCKHDGDQKQEKFCILNRMDQQEADVFRCDSYEKN